MFKLVRLGTLVRLCMRISNSVIGTGLYYGFLTAGVIGPSYLLLFRARIMEERSQKYGSATTGFMMGQLIMFISIYYAPLHLAFGSPYTITILGLLYLLFYFFWRNDKEFVDSLAIPGNVMRNLSTQYVFLTNLIFALFNHFVLPSSTLPRLISIYMFRCNNNKLLFLTSSFVGWFIGHILCMKGFELVLFWLRKNRSIKLNKYRAADFRNFLERIFTILFFLSCVYYLGRIPSPIRIAADKKKKRQKTSAEKGQNEKEPDIQIDTTSKEGQEGFAEEDPSLVLEDEDSATIDEKQKEKKDFFCSETPLVTLIFDYKRWNRPLRYIKNDEFQKAIRNEMSDYFFYTCQSDGKQRISFTYPPSLSTFFEMIERKGFLYTPEKLSSDELYNHWIYTNEQKRNSLSNELFQRIDALEGGYPHIDVLEKRTRLCNDETAQECLPKRYDCFLNGRSRGTTRQLPPNGKKENYYGITPTGDSKWINKFYSTLFPDYQQFEQKLDTFGEKSLLSDQGKRDSENQVQYLFGAGTTGPKDQPIQKKTKEGLDRKQIKKRGGGRSLKEIGKKVPRWAYQLIDDSQEIELKEEDPDLSQICSRNFKGVFIFDWKDFYTKLGTVEEYDEEDEDYEEILLRYSKQSDFNRDLIKGSVRAQRRKTVILKLFQTNLHSPLFLDRIDTIFSPLLKIMNPIFRIFRNWMRKSTEVKTWDYEEDQAKDGEDEAKEREDEAEAEAEKKENAEEERLEIAEVWDSTPYAHAIRGYLLLVHSILRKYIVLPSLIISKNFSFILLFPFQFRDKFPEWYKNWDEDWKTSGREIHVNCTHNGVTISETEFPQNWLTDGMQIKILFPFRLRYSFQLRPYHNQKETIQNKKRKKPKSSFLTTWGMETERPFGAPREEPHPLEPIYKEFEKRIREAKTNCFLLLKKKAQWILDPFLKKKKLEKGNRNKKFGLRNRDELSSRIQSMDWTKFSLPEQKIKDLSDRTSTIRNQIEKITKEKKTNFRIPYININRSSSEANFAELDSSKNLWQIVKRRSVRFIRKGPFFLPFFIESIFFKSLIYISRVNVQTFLELFELKKKIIDKDSYYKQIKKKEIDQTTIHWISTIKNKKKKFYNIGDKNSKNLCGIVSLSQAYVFYKLSQSLSIQKYPLKSVLQYYPTSFFLKDRIKHFFGTHGIDYAKSKHTDKEHRNEEMNEWKNWLRSHYQYDLSETRLSKFMSQKFHNRINQSPKVLNLDSASLDSYETNPLIDFEKPKEKGASLAVKTKTEKLKKHYKYDLLSQKYIYYEEKKDFSSYRLPLQGNEGRGIPSKYVMYKPDFFYIRRDIRKNQDRKYLDWKIISFIKTRNIQAWINTKTKIATHYSPIINTIDKKDLFYRAIQKQFNSAKNNKKNKTNKKNHPFDWMRMNKERLTQTQRRKKSISDKYRMKPWIIPIKLLLFEFGTNEKNQNVRDIRENKNTKEKETKDLEGENKNQEEKNKPAQEKKKKKKQQDVKVKQASGGSDIKKYKNKENNKKKKWKPTTDLEIFLKKKSYVGFQFKWSNLFEENIITAINICSFLLRMRDPIEMAIAFFRRKEMPLEIMELMPRKPKFTLENTPEPTLENEPELTLENTPELTLENELKPTLKSEPKPTLESESEPTLESKLEPPILFPKALKRGEIIIKLIRMPRKWDGPLIMYQTIAISLIHKKKYKINFFRKTNRKYKKTQRNIANASNAFSEFIIKRKEEKIAENIDENSYDFLLLEKITSTRRRREFRSLICLNSGKENIYSVGTKKGFGNENKRKNCSPLFTNSKDLDIETNQFIKLNFFLWPNYRLEDLACMNRSWFDISNGSRFSMLRIQMYPRLRIRF